MRTTRKQEKPESKEEFVVAVPTEQRFETLRGGKAEFIPPAMIQRITTPDSVSVKWHLTIDGTLHIDELKVEVREGRI
jgi:hypothetical protein